MTGGASLAKYPRLMRFTAFIILRTILWYSHVEIRHAMSIKTM
jgi:hypothetical protein